MSDFYKSGKFLFLIMGMFVLLSFNLTSQQKNPVLEYCTGTWCGYCPDGHAIIRNDILPAFPNAIVIGYHGPIGYGDPFAGFDGYSIMGQLNFSSYPTGIIDRTSGPLSRSQWYNRVFIQNSVTPKIELSADRTFNPTTREFSVTVDVTALEDLSGQYKVQVILLESGLKASQSNGGTDYIHDHVVRAVINGAAGTMLNESAGWNSGTTVSKSFNYTIDEDFNEAESEVVIIVYGSTTPVYSSTILQGIKFPVLGGSGSNVFVNGDWNLVSVPYEAENMYCSSLFPDAISDAYSFSSSYTPVSELEVGNGYWLKFDETAEYEITGNVVTTPVQLSEGWNLIGVHNELVNVSGVTTSPANIISTPFYGFEGNYSIVEKLSPGKGYWVKASEAGVMNISSSVAKAEPENKQASVNSNWGRIIITDANGNSTSLYIAENSVIGEAYELPPVPPAGIFDARFASGKFAEVLETGKAIDLNSVAYPVRITLYNTELNVSDISGKVIDQVLADGEQIVITNNSVNKLLVSSVTPPQEFSLEQNYPNPFNPSTKIKFNIAENSDVKLAIYNLLGEKVAEPINDNMEAGSYEFEFNASQLSSGIYFYTLSTPKVTMSKKMTVLK